MTNGEGLRSYSLIVHFTDLLLVGHPFVFYVMSPLVEGLYIANTIMRVRELARERQLC